MEYSLMMAIGVLLVYWDPTMELQITYRQLIPVQITIGGLDHTLAKWRRPASETIESLVSSYCAACF